MKFADAFSAEPIVRLQVVAVPDAAQAPPQLANFDVPIAAAVSVTIPPLA